MRTKFDNLTALALLFTITACFTSTSATQAATATLSASKDNTLINSLTGAVSNGAGPLFSGATGGRGPGAQRALVAFDIASEIPAGAVITGVELTLSVLQGGPGSSSQEYSLHRVEQDWGEGTSQATGGDGAAAATNDATWVHTFFDTATWNTPGGDFVSTPSASDIIGTFGPEMWGSTPELVADVQGWLDDPSSNFGWILIGDESAAASSRQFSSRELVNGPSLTVTYIPEPTTLACGLVGLLGFASCLRVRPSQTN